MNWIMETIASSGCLKFDKEEFDSFRQTMQNTSVTPGLMAMLGSDPGKFLLCQQHIEVF